MYCYLNGFQYQYWEQYYLLIDEWGMPKVSVIMPVYNTEKYVWEAIESVLKQAFTDFELIIVDDGSTDRSWKIIQKYAKKDTRIKAYRNTQNKKLVYTRNIALSYRDPNSEYVGICDADDTVDIHRLESVIEYMDTNLSISVVGVNLQYMDATWNKWAIYTYATEPEQKKRITMHQSPLSHWGSLIRIRDWKKIWLHYDESFLRAHDYELWTRFIWNGYSLSGIDSVLAYHRVFGWEQWKKKFLKITLANTIKLQWRLMMRYHQRPTLQSLCYFFAELLLYTLPASLVFWIFTHMRKIHG